MKVRISKFNVAMELKNSGIKFEVRDNDDNFRGSLYLSRASIVWCEGRKKRENGVKVTWDEFIDWMNG